MIANALALLILLIFLLALLLLTPRIRRGQTVALRPLPGLQAARDAITRAAEEGRAIHLSPGPGSVAADARTTAPTLAGLTVTGRLAERCAAGGTPLLVTTGAALTFPLAENAVRAGFATSGRLDEMPGTGAEGAAGVRMLVHQDPLAYAAATGDISEHEAIGNAVLIGGWGAEYLLVNEAQQRATIPTVAGATDPQALAPMLLGAGHTLIGEEIYAPGAYLEANPAHQASLVVQDAVRLLLIVLILVGAVLASLGLPIANLLGGAP